jgi:membrane protein DedA with SNARE-associated domain
MSDLLSDLVSRYGFLLVGIFLFVEAIGVPIPGETALVTAAALAGRGAMSITGVIISAIAGTISGGATAYWFGLRGGAALIARYGRALRIDEAKLQKAHGFFQLHGAKTVVLGRFVAFFRSYIGLFAGISRMPAARFLLYNAIGGVVWTLSFSTLGYVFGRNLPRLIRDLGRVSLLLAIFIAFVAGMIFLWRWYAANRVALIGSIDRWWARLAQSPAWRTMQMRHPRIWQLVSGRFARGEYLALHLTAGFTVSLFAIGMFGAITEDIVEGSPLTRFDIAVATRLYESVSPEAHRLMIVVSAAGSATTMTALLCAGALVFAMRGRGFDLAAWCAAFIGGALLDAALRFVVHRSALPFAEQVVANWTTGLASGHVLGAVVGYGMLSYFLASATRRAPLRALIIAAATLVVVMITVSRLYLGRHYVSDAAAGLAAGMIWLTTCISGLEIARHQGRFVTPS